MYSTFFAPRRNPSSTTEARAFTVPEENLRELQVKFDRIIKRAKKLKVDPPVLTVDSTPTTKRYQFNPMDSIDPDADRKVRLYDLKEGEPVKQGWRLKVRRFYTVTLTGRSPVLPGGWQLAAVLTRVEDGNLIASTGKHEIPKRYRETESQCDHCQLNRRRNETFLVTNEAGAWRQIGRNCIGDFLGSHSMNPDLIVAMAEMLASAISAAEESENELGGGGSNYEKEWSLDEVVAFSVAVIGKLGFVSAKRAEESGRPSTRSIVMTHMRPTPFDLREMRKNDPPGHIVPTDADYETAEKIIDWAAANTGDSDFDHNMRMLAKHRFADRRTLGIAVYLAEGYDRTQRSAKEAREPRVESQYVGTVGDRVVMTLTVKSTRVMPPSDWGVSTLVMFRDEAGNSLKWFASGDRSDWKEGDVVTVKATIKGHEEYKGSKQTMLTRVQEFDAGEEATKKAVAKEAAKMKAAEMKLMKAAGVVIGEENATFDGKLFATKVYGENKADFTARVRKLFALHQQGVTIEIDERGRTATATRHGAVIATKEDYYGSISDFLDRVIGIVESEKELTVRQNPRRKPRPVAPGQWW